MTLEKEPLGHNIQWPMVRLSSFYRFLKKDFVGPVMLDQEGSWKGETITRVVVGHWGGFP